MPPMAAMPMSPAAAGFAMAAGLNMPMATADGRGMAMGLGTLACAIASQFAMRFCPFCAMAAWWAAAAEG